MRVSLVTTATAYPARENMAHLERFFLRRGDHVQIYACGSDSEFAPTMGDTMSASSATCGDLAERPEFRYSELFIFHVDAFDPILDTVYALDRGVVILWLQPQNVCADDHSLPDEILRLASASDIVVVNDRDCQQYLLESGVAEPTRLRIVSPAVSLSEFSAAPPDHTLLHKSNLLGKRVLLYVTPADTAHISQAVLTLLEDVRAGAADVVLALAPAQEDGATLPPGMTNQDSVRMLPRILDRSAYYRLADLLLAQSCRSEGRQHALEAMACGTPVLFDQHGGSYSAEDALLMLSDDVAYGESVRRGLDIAAQHSTEAFEEAWASVIADACEWLPVRLSSQDSPHRSESATAPPILSNAGVAALRTDALGIDVEQLQSMAAVTLPTYEVRSPTPVFGPIIAWIRRNLTSHLRKPYLDPTLDRQEAFNIRAANTLKELATQVALYRQEITDNEAIRRLPAYLQVSELLDEAETIVESMAIDDAAKIRAENARTALSKIREILAGPISGDRTDEDI